MEAPPVPPPDDADVYLRAGVAALLGKRVDTPVVIGCARFLRKAVAVYAALPPAWAGLVWARIGRNGEIDWQRFRED